MGITVERVMTDNGSCYLSTIHADACRELGLRHLPPVPTGPDQRQGRALHPDAVVNWAYGRFFGSSAERTAALPGWLDHYNFSRRHGSLGHRPPGARLAELQEQPG